MESDLSLIEIAGEDDSLLQQIPTLSDTTTAAKNVNTNNIYFSCSPLKLPVPMQSAAPPRTSLSKGSVGTVDPAKSCCSSTIVSSNKENLPINKSEEPKLSIEPLQMKRKKKGGGCNLRKSLAWDRAFFTDEGVLDPLELSMITGTVGNQCGNALPVIREEGKEPFRGCATDSLDLRAFAETPFNEFDDTTLKKDREKGGFLLAKPESSSRDNVTRKVLSTHGGSRTGSKGNGCPRPLASSSSKRPANLNSFSAAKKESKLPRIPVSKPGRCSIPTNAKSTIMSSSHVKHNQIAQPVANIQKIVGLKSSFKIANNEQPKIGPSSVRLPAKYSVASRNLSSLLGAHSATNTKSQMVLNTHQVPEVKPDIFPSSRVQLSKGQDGSTVSLPQSNRPVSGNTQYAKNQTRKPSGLRMPSPSLRFFDQPKESSSESLSPENAQPFPPLDAGDFGLQKFDELRPPYTPGKMTKMVIDVEDGVKTQVPCSSNRYAPPSACNTSHKILNLEFKVYNGQEEVINISQDCKSYGPLDFKHDCLDIPNAKQNIQEYMEHKEMGNIASEEGEELWACDNQMLSQNELDERLREDNYDNIVSSGTGSTDDGRTSWESPSCTMNVILVTGTEAKSAPLEDNLTNKSSVGDAKPQGLSEIVLAENCYSDLNTSAEYRQELRTSLENPRCTMTAIHVTGTEAEPATGVDNLTYKSPVGTGTEAEAATGVEHLQLKDLFLVVEQNSQHNPDLHMDDNLLLARRSCYEDFHREKVIEGVECVIPERNDCCGSEFYGSSVIMSHSPGQMQDAGSDIDEMVERPPLGVLASEAIAPVVEKYGSSNIHFKINTEAASSEIGASLGGELILLSQSGQTLLSESSVHAGRERLKNDFLVEVESKKSMDIYHPKCQIVEASGDLLFGKNRVVEESQNVGNMASSSQVFQGSNGVELEFSHRPSHFQSAEQAHEGVGEVNDMTSESHVEDALGSVLNLGKMDHRPHLVDATLGSKGIEFSAKNHEYRSDKQSRHGIKLKGQVISSELDSAHMIKEDHIKALITSCAEHSCCEDSHVEEFIESVQCVIPERSDVSGESNVSSTIISQLFVQIQDAGAVIDEMEELPFSEALGFKDTAPSVESDDGLVDTHFRHDFENSGKAASSEFDTSLSQELILLTQSSPTSVNGRNLQSAGGRGLKNDFIADEAKNKKSIYDSPQKSMTTESGGSYPGVSRAAEDSQKYYLGNMVDCSPIVRGNNVESESSHRQYHIQDAEQARESKVDDTTGKSHVDHAQDSDICFAIMDGQHDVVDVTSGSEQNEFSAEYHEHCTYKQSRHDLVLKGQPISSEFDSGLMVNEDRITAVITTCVEQCSVNEEVDLLVRGDHTLSTNSQVGVEFDKLMIFPDETEPKISQDSSSPIGELHDELDYTRCSAKDNDVISKVKRSETVRKKDNLMIKPPPNAVPFSDEWLAAIETAGEDILTMKSGAVQNSPPDKSLPEPGPWSPVKRKNNQIGPFDCTKKFTSNLLADLQ